MNMPIDEMEKQKLSAEIEKLQEEAKALSQDRNRSFFSKSRLYQAIVAAIIAVPIMGFYVFNVAIPIYSADESINSKRNELKELENEELKRNLSAEKRRLSDLEKSTEKQKIQNASTQQDLKQEVAKLNIILQEQIEAAPTNSPIQQTLKAKQLELKHLESNLSVYQWTVSATDDWISTGISTTTDFVLSFQSKGTIGLSKKSEVKADPDGVPQNTWKNNYSYPLINENTGALIGKISDRGEPFKIGDKFRYVPPNDGVIFLRVNDKKLTDNSGAFDVTITIEKDDSAYRDRDIL